MAVSGGPAVELGVGAAGRRVAPSGSWRPSACARLRTPSAGGSRARHLFRARAAPQPRVRGGGARGDRGAASCGRPHRRAGGVHPARPRPAARGDAAADRGAQPRRFWYWGLWAAGARAKAERAPVSTRSRPSPRSGWHCVRGTMSARSSRSSTGPSGSGRPRSAPCRRTSRATPGRATRGRATRGRATRVERQRAARSLRADAHVRAVPGALGSGRGARAAARLPRPRRGLGPPVRVAGAPSWRTGGPCSTTSSPGPATRTPRLRGERARRRGLAGPRGARMAARIAETVDRLAADRPASDRSDTPGGPVLVVTGAFHTLALVDALSGAPEGALVRDRQPEGGFGPTAQGEAWLVRYDHERLDGLRGYGAGMPSPGYYERLHAAHQRELGFDGPGTGSPRDPRAGSGTAPASASTSASDTASASDKASSSDRASGSDTVSGSTSAGPVGARALATEVLVDVARGAAERGHTVSLPQVSAAAESASRSRTCASAPSRAARTCWTRCGRATCRTTAASAGRASPAAAGTGDRGGVRRPVPR